MIKNKISTAITSSLVIRSSLVITSSLGIAALSVSSMATAAVTTYEWSGMAIYLGQQGDALCNTSVYTKGANCFQTPVTGTMSFDDATGAGIGSVNDYDFFSGDTPARIHDMSLQLVGDGMGGEGTLVVANMLFDWNGTNDIGRSMVWDAAGFFGATNAMWADNTLDQSDVADIGAVPAADGTYVNPTFGYINLGPVPFAVTAFDTTNFNGCSPGADSDFSNNDGGGCMGIPLSGGLPLITDTATNDADYDLTTPTLSDLANEGIGGSPMQDGPFKGFSGTYEILSMAIVDDPNAPTNIDPFDVYPAIPVPAAVWLFGSGLLGLIGFARRNKSES